MDWYDSLIGVNTIPIYLEDLFRRVNILDEAQTSFTVVLFGSLSRPLSDPCNNCLPPSLSLCHFSLCVAHSPIPATPEEWGGGGAKSKTTAKKPGILLI
jgi:hypothetical protein